MTSLFPIHNLEDSFEIVYKTVTPEYVEEIVEKFREAEAVHGRQFLSIMRAKLDGLCPQYILLNSGDDSQMIEPNLEVEINRFRLMIRDKLALHAMEIENYIALAVITCETKMAFGRQYGMTVIPKTNWEQWYKGIVDTCETLHAKCPHFFCQGLKAWLNAVERDMLIPVNRIHLRRPGPDFQRRNVEEDDWEDCLERLDDYKYNEMCGFILAVVEFFVVNTKTAFDNNKLEFNIAVTRPEKKKIVIKNLRAKVETLKPLESKVCANEQSDFATRSPTANLPNKCNGFLKMYRSPM